MRGLWGGYLKLTWVGRLVVAVLAVATAAGVILDFIFPPNPPEVDPAQPAAVLFWFGVLVIGAAIVLDWMYRGVRGLVRRRRAAPTTQ